MLTLPAARSARGADPSTPSTGSGVLGSGREDVSGTVQSDPNLIQILLSRFIN